MPVEAKDKIDRVREAVNLLKQLKEIGFLDTSQGYKDIKAVLDVWIADGVSWSGKIKLVEFGYAAEIVLPSRATAVASMHLKRMN
jgi:hypothetical protein